MTDEQKTEKNAAAQQEYRDLLAHYLHTFGGESGKRVLAHLHTTTGTRLSSFHPGGNGTGMDALAAAKRDGGKTLVWHIEAILEEARGHAAGKTKPDTTGGPTPHSPHRTRRKSG